MAVRTAYEGTDKPGELPPSKMLDTVREIDFEFAAEEIAAIQAAQEV